MASFATSLSDQNGSQAISGAVAWAQGTLLGTVATSVAVIAIFVVGLRMLTGHIDVKRGATVICGCFILFGAPTIAVGLQNVGSYTAPIFYPTIQAPDAPQHATIPPPVAPAADPYAGATLP